MAELGATVKKKKSKKNTKKFLIFSVFHFFSPTLYKKFYVNNRKKKGEKFFHLFFFFVYYKLFSNIKFLKKKKAKIYRCCSLAVSEKGKKNRLITKYCFYTQNCFYFGLVFCCFIDKN